MLTTHRTFSFVASATIALAVAANAVAFAVLKTVLNPLPYRNAARLVAIAETDRSTLDPQSVSYATAHDWAARTRSFDRLSTYGDTAVRFIRHDQVEMVRGMQVSAEFFDTLGVPMYLGRPFEPSEDRRGRDRVVVLTHETWAALFDADPSIIGRAVPTIGGPYTIVGVLPADFHPLHMSNPAELPRVFVPYDATGADCRAAPCRRAGVVARLSPDVTIGQAASEIAGITRNLAREHPGDYPDGESAAVTPLRTEIVGHFESAARMVEVSVVLLLALACANLATLLLARTFSRQAEFAVRSALGASRWQVIRQLLIEGLLLAGAGGAAGGSCAWWATRLIARTSDANIPRIGELSPDVSTVLFALAVSALTAIAAGLGPALVASGQSFVAMRSASGVSRHAHQRTLRALVGVELALAFALVMIVGLLGRSYLRLLDVNPGFDPNNVLTLSLLPDGVHYPTQPQRLAWFDRVVERMRRIPDLEDAAYASTLPLSHPAPFPIFVREQPLGRAASAPVVDAYLVSPNYPEIMRIPLLAGRTFADGDSPRSERVALVSESAARRYFGGRGAIGQHVQIDERRDAGPWARIVGVVGDVHQYGLNRGADPAVYLLFAQTQPAPQGWASLVVRSRVPPERIESEVRAAMLDVDPLQPIFHLQPMTTYISLSVSQRTFALALIAAIGALALALATGGVYAVVSYVVERRTREIGLRLALGASTGAVRRMIMRQMLDVAAVAIMCGVCLAIFVASGVSSLLFGIGPLDPSTMIAVGAVIVAATLGASAIPVWRASQTDPMIALRAD
jgi:putative ABC transport system permease protein